MDKFECNTCFHKKVCMECPSIGGVNEKCPQYINVEIDNSLQQLKAEIRSVVDDFVCIPPVRIAQEIDNLIYKLRELSAV